MAKSKSNPALPPGWKPPRVLDIGQMYACTFAMRDVEVRGKPLVEVMTLMAPLADLEADLKERLKLERRDPRTKYYIRKSGPRYSYGFYRESWALKLYDFLRKADLDREVYHSIMGLLFGYTPEAIQQLISKDKKDHFQKLKK
ncbi:hypothetical protein KW784_02250 [Candidatus Parcubacteria bacterium]|nr:hypothetical protein [Candidatus Parcubacteria bacterium]